MDGKSVSLHLPLCCPTALLNPVFKKKKKTTRRWGNQCGGPDFCLHTCPLQADRSSDYCKRENKQADPPLLVVCLSLPGSPEASFPSQLCMSVFPSGSLIPRTFPSSPWYSDLYPTPVAALTTTFHSARKE